MRNLAQRMGLPMPKLYIIPDDSPNAFATGRNPKHASVAFTAGILRLMSDNELEGVIAHELGHVLHRDILISSVAATIAAAITMLARMAFWFGGAGSRDDDDRGGADRRHRHDDPRAHRRHADPDGDLALARVRCRRGLRQVRRLALSADRRLAEARNLVEAHPHGRFAGHRAHVHHQAVHRRKPHAPVLHAPLDRGSHRPPAGDAMNEVRVNRKAADRVASGHPWIFTSDITDRDGAQPGEAVKVADPRGRPLGHRPLQLHFPNRHAHALAAGRRDRPRFLICAACAPPRRTAARWCATPTPTASSTARPTCCPALIVDRYGDYLVVQTLDQGMDAAKAEIVSCLEEIFAAQGHRRAQRRRGAHQGAAAARNRDARRRSSRIRARCE